MKLILVGFILTILVLPFCLAVAIMALVGLFKGKDNPTKTTMIVKLLLMPWYVMNFIFCVLIIVGFLNPWLMLFAPLAACILIGFTYLLMLSTSIFDIAFIIRNIVKKNLKVNALLVFTIIFLFSFCFDVIGSIILYFKAKKINESILSE